MSSTTETTADSDNDEQTIDYNDPDVLRESYWERGLSFADIGDRASVSHGTIWKRMDKHGIPRREPNSEKPPHLRETKTGYLRMSTANPDGGLDRVLIHRLVAVAEYGFDAVCDKHIHHKSHHGLDNRHENLVPLSPAEHAVEHGLGRKRDEKGTFTESL
jgi:hypothetical protein